MRRSWGRSRGLSVVGDTVVRMSSRSGRRRSTPAPSSAPSSAPRTERLEVDGAEVEVRRSARRRRTVSAYEQQGRLVVLLPDGLSREQETDWIRRMSGRVRARRQDDVVSDEALLARAGELSRRYLRGRVEPSSVRWSSRQRTRWGSCTPATGSIRISESVRPMPGWVLDYVLLHELAHLLEPGHGSSFWALLSAYPRLERARGYLEGVAAATNRPDLAAALCDDESPDSREPDGRRPDVGGDATSRAWQQGTPR